MSNLGWFECADIRSVPDLWTPGRIDPAAWFDAGEDSTIVLSSGRVSQWSDKSGNGRHATMATAAYQPVVQLGPLGRNTIYFDGATRYLELGTALGKPENFSVFIVGKFITSASRTNMCGSSNSDGSSATSWGCIGTGRTANDGKIEYSISDGTNYGYGITTNQIVSSGVWFSGGWVYSGGSKPKWYDGGLECPVTLWGGTATTNTGTPYAYCIGRVGGYNGQYLNGNIAELVIFQRAINTAEILRLSGYFAWKWGLV